MVREASSQWDRTGLTRLTDDPARDRFPAVSPDGTKIAFHSNRDGNDEVYVVNADGSARIRLTDDPARDAHPNWSPHGTKIAFETARDGNFEVYVMSADGTAPRRLTDDPASDGGPVWSSPSTARALGSIEVTTMTAGEDLDTDDDIYLGNPGGTLYADYDVDPRSGRFLMIKSEQEARDAELVVVVNWLRS